MPPTSTNHFREKVPHITNATAYSLHRTDFTSDTEPALYLHFHPEYELLYVTDGALCITVQAQNYSLKSGEALFIPPRLLHSATALTETGTFYAVVFSDTVLNTSREHFAAQLHTGTGNITHICKLSTQESWQYEALFYLKRIFSSRPEMSESASYVQSHISIIWEYLYKYHISQFIKEAPNTPVNSVLEYIHNHYTEDISLNDLTAIAHMSKEHLCRLFKKSTGQSPITYLKQYRILKSCYYLKETDKKISEVCSLVGFNNVSYFNREFLRVLQTTPSKYRSRD